jgi:hypothetical protein
LASSFAAYGAAHLEVSLCDASFDLDVWRPLEICTSLQKTQFSEM